jgi:hypothetical protein
MPDPRAVEPWGLIGYLVATLHSDGVITPESWAKAVAASPRED